MEEADRYVVFLARVMSKWVNIPGVIQYAYFLSSCVAGSTSSVLFFSFITLFIMGMRWLSRATYYFPPNENILVDDIRAKLASDHISITIFTWPEKTSLSPTTATFPFALHACRNEWTAVAPRGHLLWPIAEISIRSLPISRWLNTVTQLPNRRRAPRSDPLSAVIAPTSPVN